MPALSPALFWVMLGTRWEQMGLSELPGHCRVRPVTRQCQPREVKDGVRDPTWDIREGVPTEVITNLIPKRSAGIRTRQGRGTTQAVMTCSAPKSHQLCGVMLKTRLWLRHPWCLSSQSNEETGLSPERVMGEAQRTVGAQRNAWCSLGRQGRLPGGGNSVET